MVFKIYKILLVAYHIFTDGSVYHAGDDAATTAAFAVVIIGQYTDAGTGDYYRCHGVLGSKL